MYVSVRADASSGARRDNVTIARLQLRGNRVDGVELTTGDQPEQSVIWLHGLGADGNDFVPIVPELGLRNTRFVFPHAPLRPVTINSGMACRAWFDITTLDHRTPDAMDMDGLFDSVSKVHALIDAECQRGIPSTRIAVAGFSQGGATALTAALDYPEKLAGILGLSTWAPFAEPQSGVANLATPVFLAHGQFDPLVSPQLGEQTRDVLVAAGMAVDWKTYPMAHAVCPQEITDIAAFLRRVLG